MKGGEFVLLGRTQHNGGDSISVGANVYSAVGDFISFKLSPGETLSRYIVSEGGGLFMGRFYNATPASALTEATESELMPRSPIISLLTYKCLQLGRAPVYFVVIGFPCLLYYF